MKYSKQEQKLIETLTNRLMDYDFLMAVAMVKETNELTGTVTFYSRDEQDAVVRKYLKEKYGSK
jgi:hypothetical protein